MKVKIENTEYNIPQSWNDITYNQFLLITAAATRNAEPLEMLSLITGIDQEVLSHCTVQGLTDISTLVSFVQEADTLEPYNVVDEKLQVDIRNMPYYKYEICSQEVKRLWAELYPDKSQLEPEEVLNVYMNAAPVIVREYLEIEIGEMPVSTTYGLALFFSKVFLNSMTHIVS